MPISQEQLIKILPKTIKIGWKLYSVESWPHENAEAKQRFGEIDYNKSIIRVDISYGARQTLEILTHEIYHGMIHMFGKRKPDQDEEDYVLYTASYLSTVFVDNPDLMEFYNKICGDPDA